MRVWVLSSFIALIEAVDGTRCRGGLGFGRDDTGMAVTLLYAGKHETSWYNDFYYCE